MDWNLQIIGRAVERISRRTAFACGSTRRLQAHAAGCSNCAQLLSQVSGLVGQLHQLEELEAPPRLVQNILDATIWAAHTGKRLDRMVRWMPALWQPRLAMGGHHCCRARSPS